MGTRTEFSTYVDGEIVYSGSSLPDAIRTWDASTHSTPKASGGVLVQQFANGLCVRDGWVLHVFENGQTYLNPNLALSE